LKTRLFFLLLITIGLLPSAMAAPTLAEVIDAALQHHPDRLLPAARKRLADGYRRQADALLGGDPAVALSAWNDMIGNDDGYREQQASLALPLRPPGLRDARRRQAELIDGEAEALTQRLRWQVAAGVLQRLWALHLAERELALDVRQHAAAIALEKTVARRVEAGELARSELLLAQQERLTREVIVQDARSALDKARADWLSFTGSSELPASFTPTPLPAEASIDEDHPLLRPARLAMERAIAQRYETQIRRRENPVLSLYLKRDRGAARDPYNEYVGAEISIPFGTALHNAPALAEAAEQVEISRAAYAETRRQLTLNLTHARQELDRARAALTLAQKRDQLAQQRLHMSERAFELGETGLYLLLQARGKAIDAARELDRSQIRHQRAIVEYNLALGAIPE